MTVNNRGRGTINGKYRTQSQVLCFVNTSLEVVDRHNTSCYRLMELLDYNCPARCVCVKLEVSMHECPCRERASVICLHKTVERME